MIKMMELSWNKTHKQQEIILLPSTFIKWAHKLKTHTWRIGFHDTWLEAKKDDLFTKLKPLNMEESLNFMGFGYIVHHIVAILLPHSGD